MSIISMINITKKSQHFADSFGKIGAIAANPLNCSFDVINYTIIVLQCQYFFYKKKQSINDCFLRKVLAYANFCLSSEFILNRIFNIVKLKIPQVENLDSVNSLILFFL